jgi:hypothetical protein
MNLNIDCARCRKSKLDLILFPIFMFHTTLYAYPEPVFIPNYTWVCEDCYKNHIESLKKEADYFANKEIEIIEGAQNISKSY